ncbi:hypothetical protein EVAR_73658_1 [Eumeta japonica]|uniref:RNA-directed DNA polymerase from transposon BS n=1 Tax=Eumeta variegata TaxID=151549 RepID=A0A4C1TQG4_EUMVA|nr:hypothetical protein EVAR_73658_1 [Eumeta japonica]
MIPQVVHMVQQGRATRPKLRPILTSRLPTRIKLAVCNYYIRSFLTYAALAWYALCSEQQHQRLRAQQNLVLRMIVEAGLYVKNNLIARDVGVQSIEDFIRIHARRLFNYIDEGPILSLHNLAPQYK